MTARRSRTRAAAPNGRSCRRSTGPVSIASPRRAPRRSQRMAAERRRRCLESREVGPVSDRSPGDASHSMARAARAGKHAPQGRARALLRSWIPARDGASVLEGPGRGLGPFGPDVSRLPPTRPDSRPSPLRPQAERGHGFPRSHGPTEAIVNRRALTIWLTVGTSGRAPSSPCATPKASLPEPSPAHIFCSNV
jgi:hypothetical protein